MKNLSRIPCHQLKTEIMCMDTVISFTQKSQSMGTVVFPAHPITVGTIKLACLARDALHQNISLCLAYHFNYTYCFKDDSGDQKEDFSDDV